MCRFTERNAEIKSQLITGCLSEKVRQKGLMNPNMLLGDLINYAKMTETISKQMEQMRLEDANSTTKPTTSINQELMFSANWILTKATTNWN